MYKSRVQELCQKKNWELPIYTTGKNGPSHMPRFTATISVQGQAFQTSEEFKSGKEAQNAAARVAYDHFNNPSPVAAPNSPPPEMQSVLDLFPLSPFPSSLPIPSPGLLPDTKPANGEVLQENSADAQTSTVDILSNDKTFEGLYKKNLNEFAQKKGLLCPSYETIGSGMSHMPIFKSVVAIGTDTFQGDEAKTKKQAEMNAAKVAFLALTKGPDLLAGRANASSETFENQLLQQMKTVVIPRELNWPIPEHANVKSYSNKEWVAYEVKLDKEVTV